MSVVPSSPPAAGVLQPLRAGGSPVFFRDCGEYIMYYAPGCLVVVGSEGAEQFEVAIGPPAASRNGPHQDLYWAGELGRRAEFAMVSAAALRYEPFRPECLTLYLNNECNLHCVYCYADPSPRSTVRLDLDAASAAAEQVAKNCRVKGLPFYIVLHGGGEPALHRHQVERFLEMLHDIAARHDIETFRYIATNGVMPEDRAAWLAGRFDLVGLSCDGPADIHDRQRPGLDGRGTLHLVERTAHILREQGIPFNTRATITAMGLHRQAKIADYLAQLRPEEIRFEPVYRGGRAGGDIQLDGSHAEAFVTGFLEARQVAAAHGIPLFMSGSRPGSIHGPYCNLFRQVLNLVPGGVATTCFKITDASQARKTGLAIGALNRETGRFDVQHRRVRTLRQQLAATPHECAGCFNRYHCVRGCPDHCPIGGAGALRAGEEDFRCRVQRSLTTVILAEMAEQLWSEVSAGKVRGPHGRTIL